MPLLTSYYRYGRANQAVYGLPSPPRAVSVATLRQTASSGGAGSVTLGSAPLAGNLMLAIAAHNSAISINSITQTGVVWTRIHRYAPNPGIDIWCGVAGAGAGTGVSWVMGAGSFYGSVSEIQVQGITGVPVAYTDVPSSITTLQYRPVGGLASRLVVFATAAGGGITPSCSGSYGVFNVSGAGTQIGVALVGTAYPTVMQFTSNSSSAIYTVVEIG
jgi:hypothetical protein